MSFPPMGDEFNIQHPQEVYQGELTNMKAQLGRPTGLALALLATLLATFLAMGVFSVALAQESPTRSFSSETVEAGGTLDVTIAITGFNGQVEETLPDGFTFVSSSFVPAANGRVSDAIEPEIIFTVFGASSLTYSVMAPDPLPAGAQTFSGVVKPIGASEVSIGGATSVNDPATTNGNGGGNGNGTDEDDLATRSTEPGSNQSLTVRGMVEYATSDNITVNLASFGVPSSINVDHVTVSIGDDMDANPTDVEIDGTKITLIAPFDPDDANADRLSSDDSDTTTITFRRSAGITLPTVHGDYDIKVSTEETREGTAEEEEGVGGDGVKNTVKVRRQVKVSPTSGKRGTEITITAKGYSDNTHDIVIGSGDNSLTQTADATDGVFTLTVDTSVKNNDGNSVFQGPHDTSTTITVDDAEATFTIKASFSWGPESPTPGQDITVTLSDIEPEEGESVVYHHWWRRCARSWGRR